MPTYGHIDEFDTKEDIKSYLERCDQYFVANDLVPADSDNNAKKKQTAIFLASVGKSAYCVIQNLCKPNLPKDSNYKELCQLLVNHYSPTLLEVAETFKFHTKGVQKPNETVSEFVSRLRGLASSCNFGAHLPRALRDQFVVGVSNSDTQQKLLSEDRTFDKAVLVAQSDEAAMREYKELHINQYQEQSVHNMSHKSQKYNKNNNKKDKTYVCYSCGKSGHFRNQCQFKTATCVKCKRVGHLANMCYSSSTKVQVLEEEDDNTEDINELLLNVSCDNKSDDLYMSNDKICDDLDYFSLFNINSSSKSGIYIPMSIQCTNVSMLLDTGCSLSVIPYHIYKNLKGNAKLEETNITLTTFTGEKLNPMGTCNVLVHYKGLSYRLPLLVVQRGTQPLLGRNWLKSIPLNWAEVQNSINVINVNNLDKNTNPVLGSIMTDIVNSYFHLFNNELGCYTGEPIKLCVKDEPKFHKARPVPYSLLPKVEKALNDMQESGIIKHITTAPCAAPIVPVIKKSGDLRICGDFSLTYNKCGEPSRYPIPKLEDLVTSFRGCTVFSQLDMSQAYHQVPIHSDSQKWLTINTHLGLFVFTRLPNGIHSAPAEFQMLMDKTLSGLKRVVCYIDDILIGGTSISDHAENIKAVFERLSNAGFKLNKSKCSFEKKSVQYLGHIIDQEGLHPTKEKINSVQNAPPPTNVTQLKSFLGLIMFYSRFLNNHSTVLAPLNRLLQKDVDYVWTKTEQDAFVCAKNLLVNSKTLVHYDDSLPIYLACDASSYGVGVVLSHIIDGEERPVGFASSTLTPAQKNYSQLDKEALSIIYGLKHFHQYLYGRKFTIICDNKPLIHLFSPTAPIPVLAAARLQRWALILASYDYDIMYRPTAKHSNADGMSRLPLNRIFSPVEENINCLFFCEDIGTNITSDIIGKYTQCDKVLSKVFRFIQFGWPTHHLDSELMTYKQKAAELSIENNCILWNCRVVIPNILQSIILNELHDTHPGITRMRMLARSYVWWPAIDNCIHKLVSTCNVCQSMRNDPPKSYVHPWTFPTHAWSRVHIDFAGPISGQMYLIIVDAYSKYPEVVKMSSTSSQSTIGVLRQIFSRLGFPDTLVSDNGPQFVSDEFKQFCNNNGICHITSAVYKPSTNGQAERVVQILKSAVKQSKVSGESLHILLPRFLLRYRITPHSTTGKSPSLLFYGRQLRTKLDLVFPSLRSNVEQKQNNIINRTIHRGCRFFSVGDSILFRNFGKGEKWLKGFVIEILGQRHYLVHCAQSGTVKRHIDQIIRRSSSNDIVHNTMNDNVYDTCSDADNNVASNSNDLIEPNIVDRSPDSFIPFSFEPQESNVEMPPSFETNDIPTPLTPQLPPPPSPTPNSPPTINKSPDPIVIRKSSRVLKSTLTGKYKDYNCKQEK